MSGLWAQAFHKAALRALILSVSVIAIAYWRNGEIHIFRWLLGSALIYFVLVAIERWGLQLKRTTRNG